MRSGNRIPCGTRALLRNACAHRSLPPAFAPAHGTQTSACVTTQLPTHDDADPAPCSPRRIVLTGGPGAGKTAVLELLRTMECRRVHVLPEAAGILFRGGFPRSTDPALRRPAQRAIFYVQRELEAIAEVANVEVVLCDRGTVDGLAYWPGPEDMWASLGTSLDEQLARYHTVIHLRTPPPGAGYNHVNPLRIESAQEAAEIDARIDAAWARHPRRFEIPATPDFLAKAAQAVAIVQSELLACSRGSSRSSLADSHT